MRRWPPGRGIEPEPLFAPRPFGGLRVRPACNLPIQPSVWSLPDGAPAFTIGNVPKPSIPQGRAPRQIRRRGWAGGRTSRAGAHRPGPDRPPRRAVLAGPRQRIRRPLCAAALPPVSAGPGPRDRRFKNNGMRRTGEGRSFPPASFCCPASARRGSGRCGDTRRRPARAVRKLCLGLSFGRRQGDAAPDRGGEAPQRVYTMAARGLGEKRVRRRGAACRRG